MENFKSDIFHSQIFSDYDLPLGRIFGSKSTYREIHPKHTIIFNAYALTKTSGIIWHGDLDLTLDRDNLKKVAVELEEPLYILNDGDVAFGQADIKTYIDKSNIIIKP